MSSTSRIPLLKHSPDDILPAQSKSTFWLCCVALLALNVAELSLNKVVLTFLFNYRWFFVMLISAISFIGSSIIYLLNRNDVTKEMRQISKIRFCLIALLDAMHNMCLTISIGVLPGPLALLLPLFMNLATNFSNALCGPLAFQLKQFLAFLFVAGGIVMCAISIQLNSDGCSREFPLSEAQTVWAFIFCLISVIPAILSASYKASFLQRHDMSLHYLNFWTSLFHVLLCLVLSPIALRMQYIGMDNAISDDAVSTFAHISNALQCISGQSSLLFDSCQNHTTFLMVAIPIYLLVIVLSHILNVLLLNHGAYTMLDDLHSEFHVHSDSTYSPTESPKFGASSPAWSASSPSDAFRAKQPLPPHNRQGTHSFVKSMSEGLADTAAWPQLMTLLGAFIVYEALTCSDYLKHLVGDDCTGTVTITRILAAPIVLLGCLILLRDAAVTSHELSDEEMWSSMEIAVEHSKRLPVVARSSSRAASRSNLASRSSLDVDDDTDSGPFVGPTRDMHAFSFQPGLVSGRAPTTIGGAGVHRSRSGSGSDADDFADIQRHSGPKGTTFQMRRTSSSSMVAGPSMSTSNSSGLSNILRAVSDRASTDL